MKIEFRSFNCLCAQVRPGFVAPSPNFIPFVPIATILLFFSPYISLLFLRYRRYRFIYCTYVNAPRETERSPFLSKV